jgi:hypothetical protein
MRRREPRTQTRSPRRNEQPWLGIVGKPSRAIDWPADRPCGEASRPSVSSPSRSAGNDA